MCYLYVIRQQWSSRLCAGNAVPLTNGPMTQIYQTSKDFCFHVSNLRQDIREYEKTHLQCM